MLPFFITGFIFLSTGLSAETFLYRSNALGMNLSVLGSALADSGYVLESDEKRVD